MVASADTSAGALSKSSCQAVDQQRQGDAGIALDERRPLERPKPCLTGKFCIGSVVFFHEENRITTARGIRVTLRNVPGKGNSRR